MPHSIKKLQPEKILIRSTNWIGDAIMTTPAVRTIRENFPEAHIAILSHPWVADVFRASPHVDEVIEYKKKTEHIGIAGIWRLGRQLATHDFDLTILLQNAFEAAVIARIARIPAIAGYSTDGRGGLLTHGVKLKKSIKQLHQVYYYQNIMKELGLVCGPDELFLQLTPKVVQWARQFVKDKKAGPVIGLNPGAAYGPAKRWPDEKYGRLAGRLASELSATMLVFGTAADQEATAVISGFAPDNVIDLAGKTTLEEAMALISVCDAFVTNDSGLMHVGAALKTPLAAIFGSTDAVATGPFSDNSVVIQKDLPCSPCLKETCKTDFRCMMDIHVEEVLEAVKKLLADNSLHKA
ncbi:MAG: lipopolysaccharide heptosyltransferase II [Proteobacteria bacterium]|nr:lipopolysaccharide heptosyltransferase II [Pseudomonadota bacterium]MBU1710926.1 lipopolysaccharide heptosyltransferase II [Pseudomonadota bacterium]